MEKMDNIIMPELITPRLAEVIAENPEMLKIIVGNNPGEEVIVGQNCTLDCGSNPANVKLVFCNVTIGIDETTDGKGNGCSSASEEEQAGGCHIKISGRNQNQGEEHRGAFLNEQSQLMLAVAVLEARKDEAEKILRLIPRQVLNRKLVARCKRGILEVEEELAAKKKELEHITWLMEYGE
jgi:hypothetical protein